MSRKIARRIERRRRAKRAALLYGVIPVVGALVVPLAIGGTSLASGNALVKESLYAVAAADSQSFVASSTIIQPTLDRGSYSATTPEEIAAKKAAEAAAAEEARRKEEEARIKAQAASVPDFKPKLNYAIVSPGSGEIRWPLPAGSWTLGARLGDGRNHQGVDFPADKGTPIYAAAAGTVKVAQNAFSAYGTAVVLVHNIGGQQVTTLYAHMPIDSYAVKVGDTVEAGQLIGYVGNTGRSYGNHLHFEVKINGGLVDGYDWLTANAG